MAMKQKGRKIYRTAQGKQIDLDLLIKKNEMTPAVGNARVNARGDELGPGGKIIRKREEVVQEYYKGAPVVNESTKRAQPEVTAEEAKIFEEFDEEPVPPKKTSTTKTSAKADDWVEDDEGNFVKK